MLVSDVLSRRVVCDGRPCGYVIDARFVLHGPAAPGSLAAPELVGLLVGPRRGAAFLGYERTSVTGPALVGHWLRRRQRGAFLVDLRDVEELGDPVVLRPDATRWSIALPR